MLFQRQRCQSSFRLLCGQNSSLSGTGTLQSVSQAQIIRHFGVHLKAEKASCGILARVFHRWAGNRGRGYVGQFPVPLRLATEETSRQANGLTIVKSAMRHPAAVWVSMEMGRTGSSAVCRSARASMITSHSKPNLRRRTEANSFRTCTLITPPARIAHRATSPLAPLP